MCDNPQRNIGALKNCRYDYATRPHSLSRPTDRRSANLLGIADQGQPLDDRQDFLSGRAGGRPRRAGPGLAGKAAPIFPFISQNYGLWQSAYLLSLLVVFLLWAFAMRHKFGLLENSKKGLQTQRRIDAHNARVEERRQANRERREVVRKEREENSIYFKASSGGSKKFDY